MNTEPCHTRLTARRCSSATAFVSDERGAILVLGIFMCACMAGALWYVSGIGDAILYRERLQEGADAVAFSAAVLNARGMNFIVLLNLIMALILAIRLVLKGVQAALWAVGAIVAAFPPTSATGLAIVGAGTSMTPAIRASQPIIDNAITAFGKIQDAVKRIVPPASLVGAVQVGLTYRPIVNGLPPPIAGSPELVRVGLPVEKDEESVLCVKAAEATGHIFRSLPIEVPFLAYGVESIAKGMAKLGGAYFCETSGGPSTNTNGPIGQAAAQQCQDERNRRQAALDDARRAYEEACRRMRCTQRNLTDSERREIQGLVLRVTRASDHLDDFDDKECRKDARRRGRNSIRNQQREQERQNQAEAEQAAEEEDAEGEEDTQARGGSRQRNRQQQSQPQPSQRGAGSGQRGRTPRGQSGARPRDLRPQRVAASWKNGYDETQIIGIVTGNQEMLRWGAMGAAIGALGTDVEIDTPLNSGYGLAQAEFFFDCAGPWTDRSCREDAMWRMAWRARLRRFSSPFSDGPIAGMLTNFIAGSAMLAGIRYMQPVESFTPENAVVLGELTAAVADGEFIIH